MTQTKTIADSSSTLLGSTFFGNLVGPLIYNNIGGLFMYRCQECSKEFKTFQAKANHVRWKHKEEKFSKEGYQSLKIKSSRPERFEDVNCPICETVFRRRKDKKPGEKGYKKTCSRSCGNRSRAGSYSKETKEKIRSGALNNKKWLDQMGKPSNCKRFSSKLERSLVEMLGDEFKRHHNIKFNNRRIDFDIASRDNLFLIECDGIWHFKKVHKGHDFEKVKKTDVLKEEYAKENNKVLIRIDNTKYNLQQTFDIVKKELKNRTPRIVK